MTIQPDDEFADFGETVYREDLEDALRQVLLAPADGLPKTTNREPTKAELNERWKLTRKPASP